MVISNEKISVIIPVYKAENTIERCLDSVIGQSYENLEIILVDDGSPDKSGEIRDRYAERDLRIRVFHQNNKGVSAARNTGLASMTGDYFYFIDSDDYIDLRVIESLRENALKFDADLVVGNLSVIDEDKLVVKNPPFPYVTVTESIKADPGFRYAFFILPASVVRSVTSCTERRFFEAQGYFSMSGCV